ncbi:IclR family transcriptional regulator [Lichenifustis flavocetrariae]|uniref:IclR family transcriptional regulator n=1 Tax=Lichenifustis flavocetrariae TaxID=2949735 RepID=A0AA42CIW3_9HYPH|nr:IclR family transcriptional regulator [Lichenifustis flavocetrariae]MCW6507321.1 IclR family transcriptional regulator [Lichenifustis flavocetrariae]
MTDKQALARRRKSTTEGPAAITGRERGLDRLVALLAHLHQVGRPVRIGDLARSLGAPRSTIYVLVKTLVEAGLIESSESTGEVFFGKTIYFYGMDYLRGHDLFGRARVEVDRLAQQTGELAQFCVMHEWKYTVAYMSAGARSFRVSSDIGTQIPLPWTASGRLLISDLPEHEIRRVITSEDLRPPRSAEMTLDEFIVAVAQARHDGFCVTSGLVDPFTHCIAVPIRDQTNRIVATLCFVVKVDTSADRMAFLRDLLFASAQALSLSQPADS